MIRSVSIPTVTVAPETYNLVDLQTVKTLLNISDGSLDAYFNLVIPQASDMASQDANNPFVVETLQESFYPHRENYPWQMETGIAPLQVSRWPIVSVVSVVETIDCVDTTLVEGTDFLTNKRSGQLTRLARNKYPREWWAIPISVTYQGGYSAIPPSVIKAVVDIVKGIYSARTRDPSLRSENIEGVYEAAYWFGSGPGVSGALPSVISDLLENYRVPIAG